MFACMCAGFRKFLLELQKKKNKIFYENFFDTKNFDYNLPFDVFKLSYKTLIILMPSGNIRTCLKANILSFIL